jgi:hypothetical protein
MTIRERVLAANEKLTAAGLPATTFDPEDGRSLDDETSESMFIALETMGGGEKFVDMVRSAGLPIVRVNGYGSDLLLYVEI